MLDINLIRKEPETVRKAFADRLMDSEPVDAVLALDVQRREILTHSETLRANRNAVSKEIGRSKDEAEREAKKTEMRTVGEQITTLEVELNKIEAQLNELMAGMPNIPDPRVPPGPEENFKILRTVGEPKQFDFEPKEHWVLGPALNIIDFERGVKLSGSRFYVLNGLGARLQRSIINFFLDLRLQQGYEERYLPFMVRAQTLFAAGQLPKFKDNQFHDAEEDYWMVPTAEVPLTNLHGDEILDVEELPKNYCAYTPCFRRERMSAGKDVRGIKRGFQFDKVEMYMLTKPEDSEAAHLKLLADAEETLVELGLTYRVKLLSAADMSVNMHMTYDLEVWAPGCKEWLEVSSISNGGEFQARRANIKFRREKGGKPEFVHTLNGSGMALPRTMIAVMENYQQADGSILVPEVLRKFVGTDVIR